MWETNISPVLKQIYDNEKPKELIKLILKAQNYV